jgi:hypothetical protein
MPSAYSIRRFSQFAASLLLAAGFILCLATPKIPAVGTAVVETWPQVPTSDNQVRGILHRFLSQQ